MQPLWLKTESERNFENRYNRKMVRSRIIDFWDSKMGLDVGLQGKYRVNFKPGNQA